MTSLWFLRNLNIVELYDLHDDENNVYLDGAATVQLTIKKGGAEVSGQVWPMTMDYVGPNGIFRGKVGDLDLVERDEIDITVTVTLNGESNEWNETVRVRERGDH